MYLISRHDLRHEVEVEHWFLTPLPRIGNVGSRFPQQTSLFHCYIQSGMAGLKKTEYLQFFIEFSFVQTSHQMRVKPNICFTNYSLFYFLLRCFLICDSSSYHVAVMGEMCVYDWVMLLRWKLTLFPKFLLKEKCIIFMRTHICNSCKTYCAKYDKPDKLVYANVYFLKIN